MITGLLRLFGRSWLSLGLGGKGGGTAPVAPVHVPGCVTTSIESTATVAIGFESTATVAMGLEPTATITITFEGC